MLCSDEEVLFKKTTKSKNKEKNTKQTNKKKTCQSSFYFLIKGMKIITEFLFLKRNKYIDLLQFCLHI